MDWRDNHSPARLVTTGLRPAGRPSTELRDGIHQILIGVVRFFPRADEFYELEVTLVCRCLVIAKIKDRPTRR